MKPLYGTKGRTAVLSAAHALVDMSCAALLFGQLYRGDAWLLMVLYNACAFLMQLPMGVAADRLDRNLPFAACGCILIAAAYAMTGVPVLAAMIAGLGNGAFHVGGGIEVLNSSGDKAGPLGVFVSPGAVGLYIGTAYADFLTTGVYLLPLLLILFGIWLVFSAHGMRGSLSRNAEFSVSLPKGGLTALAALFAVVTLRSFMGTTNAFSASGAFPFLPDKLAGLIPVLCLALGKAAGGYASDRFGIIRTSAVSLGVCALILFFPLSPYLTLTALFLFNMTMPITLFASARLLKGAKGTAFGLLTAALFMGCVPLFFGMGRTFAPWINGLLALASLGLLLVGLKKERA